MAHRWVGWGCVNPGWFGWRARAVSALVKLAADPRVPQDLRGEAALAVGKLAELDSRYKLPRSKMLSLTAEAAALAGKALLYGVADVAIAAAPEPPEIDDLVKGFESQPRVTFSAWKAKVVAALIRAAVAASDGELRAVLLDAAELVAEHPKPRRTRSWRSRGARDLLDLVDLVRVAAEVSGSAELATLVPTVDDLRSWLGGEIPPPPRGSALGAERVPFTEENLLSWLTQRLALEEGRVARIPARELVATFKLALSELKRVEAILERVKTVPSGRSSWIYRGATYALREGVRKGVTFNFERVG